MGAAATAAQEAPWHAADQYYDAQDMAAARKRLQQQNGAQNFYMVHGERLEYQSHHSDPLLVWDLQGWYGGDRHKLWLKTEGAYLLDDDAFEEADIQVLYSRAVTPFFDLQAGVRHDITPNPSTSYGVIGLQGLAPYWFEVDAAAFISEHGDVTARLEAEYDLLLTQRLILEPRAELAVALQDVPGLGVGAGLSTLQAGLRLRYEIRRTLAPYVGVSWRRKFGDTARYARQNGEDADTFSLVVGLRFWF